MSARPWALWILLVAALGCSKSVEAELRAARSPTEEARALERVWRECAPLTLLVEDATGNALPLSGPRFPMDARAIHIGGKCKLDHSLIDPKNVLVLLRE